VCRCSFQVSDVLVTYGALKHRQNEPNRMNSAPNARPTRIPSLAVSELSRVAQISCFVAIRSPHLQHLDYGNCAPGCCRLDKENGGKQRKPLSVMKRLLYSVSNITPTSKQQPTWFPFTVTAGTNSLAQYTKILSSYQHKRLNSGN
jgi:hypothetical protein